MHHLSLTAGLASCAQLARTPELGRCPAGAVAAAVPPQAAGLYLKSELGYPLPAPPAAYYIIIGAGLAASLGAIAATLPLLGRMTSPELARNE